MYVGGEGIYCMHPVVPAVSAGALFVCLFLDTDSYAYVGGEGCLDLCKVSTSFCLPWKMGVNLSI